MKTLKEITILHNFSTEHKTLCKCGHKTLITSKDGKALCKWCNNYVFINKEAEIRYRNKEMLIKARKELKDEQGRNNVR